MARYKMAETEKKKKGAIDKQLIIILISYCPYREVIPVTWIELRII